MAFKTELLYYTDPYKIDFSASILSVKKTPDQDSLWDVILDKTFFYPEGGGQPSDLGTISGIKVEQVVKKDGEVLHRMIFPPELGNANCLIDWDHRYDYMQQHTGQHIISGALFKSGYGTVSVHQGASVTAIEIDKPEISREDLKTVETLSNSIILKNIALKTEWISDTQLEGFSLRRKSKVSGEIRIISIGDFDQIACGGVHTSSTGEVQCVKFVAVEKIRGHSRISWKIGSRVITDYEEKTSIISSLLSTFSCRQAEILSKVKDLLASSQENKKLYSQLEVRYIGLVIKEMFKKAEKIDDIYFITEIFENESSDFLRNIVSSLSTDNKYLICIINKSGSQFQWILTVNGIDFPFPLYRQDFLKIIDAKGGGKPPVWQGVGNNEKGLELFFESLRTQLTLF